MDTKLYPGVPFSPPAALTDNIGAGDTIIPVSDVSRFPEAPNLATIGTDEGGETILYAAKTGAALSGCTRGVEGEARAWPKGEAIGRNWTAKDHNDLIAAVHEGQKAAEGAAQSLADHQEDPAAHGDIREEAEAARRAAETAQERADEAQTALAAKQDTLTGRPGQAVGFGADGTARAVQGWSSPNLLDNWYFGDPVNQRGKTEYTGTAYTIDRWFSYEGTVSLSAGVGVKVVSFIQPVESVIQFFNRQLTFSILLEDGSFISGTNVISSIETPVIFSSKDNIVTLFQSEQPRGFQIYDSSKEGLTIIAVKLELGAQQTLARQDADGSWVLNGPPPDKALELLKCQRYYQIFSEEGLRPANAVDFRPPMRAQPALGTIEIDGVTYYTADANL